MASSNLSIPPIPQIADAPAPGVPRWSSAAWVVLFWFGLYGVMMPGDMLEDYQVSQGANFMRDLFGNILQASLWCLVSPLILWVTRNHMVEAPRRLRAIGMHLMIGVPVAAAIEAIYYLGVHAVF